MSAQCVLVTGSSGLIGSQCVRHFDRLGWRVHGVDNNMRVVFLGTAGDAAPVTERLLRTCKDFHAHDIDIRYRDGILQLLRDVRPNLVIHCAAQSSQEIAKNRPFDDFDTNAGGTLNLIEAVHRFCADSPFVFLSTNKVYGGAPDELPLQELESRWEYARPEDRNGIDESCRIDSSLHTVYGASKAAADLLVQEYGRYFGMPTVCLRVSSVTGPHEIGTEPHGFLSYLARTFRENKTYRILGHQGKQVRDVMHSQDLCDAITEFYQSPRPAEVYNLGGGRENSVSILEAITGFTEIFGHALHTEYVQQHRQGDNVCYISDLRKFRDHYPGWSIRIPLDEILKACFTESAAALTER